MQARDSSGRFMRVRVTGAEEMRTKLLRASVMFPQEVAKALYEEAGIEMTEAKRRTPVDTGALRTSGHVTKPSWSGRKVSVNLYFGGPAAPYAIYVHENEDAFHRVGQAKFLESTLNESAPHFAARVSARINLNHLV